jgi:hypothetical protein
VWIQGTGDALSLLADAEAYAANCATFVGDLRAKYGATIPFIYNQLHALNTAANAPTVRAQQVLMQASIPNAHMVNYDDQGMFDAYHPDDNGVAVLGQRLGVAGVAAMQSSAVSPSKASNVVNTSYLYEHVYV